MAFNYVVTAHKPTAVNACVTGKLFCGAVWSFQFTSRTQLSTTSNQHEILSGNTEAQRKIKSEEVFLVSPIIINI